jgi:hypothetical protein
LKVIELCPPLAVTSGAAIMCHMARGWESKAVEEQIAAAEAERQTRERPALTAAERELRGRREQLLLSRAKIVSDLAAARGERHRTLLERALAHIDAQLDEVGRPDLT